MSENLKNTQESENNESINTSNIFDEFDSDWDLLSEVQKLKEENERDVYYYLSIATGVLKTLFVLMLFAIIIVGSYIYLQKNDSLNNKSFLNPICNILNWWVPIPNNVNNCSSVSYTIDSYESSIKKLKQEQTEAILPLISSIYQKQNFTKTKEVSFLLDKSENKLDVLGIINEFDKLKNNYLWLEKSKIQCENLKIDSEEMILSMKCASYSMWFEREIIGFSWEKKDRDLVWTSMSIANSFLNYIEKQSKNTQDDNKVYTFDIIDRQKVFSNQSVTWERSGYTSKTNFDLKLKINN